MQKSGPVKGKYVATVEQLLVGSAPQRAGGFWDEFFLLEPRAQWLHSTLLSATCARHATAVQPWLRDLLRAAVDAAAAAAVAPAPTTADAAAEAEATPGFGADLAWTRAANALTNAAVAVQAVCAAKLRATAEATLALVLGDDDDDSGGGAAGRATAETLLALAHAAHAVLVHDTAAATARSAKAAAARVLVVLLELAGAPQQQQQQREEDGASSVFRDSVRAVDVEGAAYALLRGTGPEAGAQEAALALLALAYVDRARTGSSGTTALLDGRDGVLDACVALLARETAAAVAECAQACASAREGWGLRWLGFRAAGWLCGAAPTGIPPATLRAAPCLYVLRELCTRNAHAAILLFDTQPRPIAVHQPLPTKLFGASATAAGPQKEEEDGRTLKYGVLARLVELLSVCLACAQKDADFAYACYADACLDTVLAVAAAGTRADVLERVGDLSLAFDADVFVPDGADGRTLARARRRGCLVDHVLRLAAAHLAGPLALPRVQLQLKCVRAVHRLYALCCFQTGPDARITVDWRALFLALLRIVRYADHVLRLAQRSSPSSSSDGSDEAVVVAAAAEGTLEHAQLLALARETLELVCESLCLGDQFAGRGAAQRLWYETMRMADRVQALLRVLEPEFVVNGDAADAAAAAAAGASSSSPVLDPRIADVLAQIAALQTDLVAQAQRGGQELDEARAAQLAEGARRRFLALESTAAAAAQRQGELGALFAQCHAQQEQEQGDPVDERYEAALCDAVRCHVHRVFQPVDQ